MNYKTPRMNRLDKILKTGVTNRWVIVNYVYEAKKGESLRQASSNYLNFNTLLKRYRTKGNVVDVKRGYLNLIEAVE